MIDFRKLFSRVRTTQELWAGQLAIGKGTLSAVHIKADGTRVNLGVICRKKVTGVFVTDIVANLVTDTTAIGDYKYHRAGIGTTTPESNTHTISTFDFTGCPTYATGTQVAGGSGTAPTYTSVATISFTSTLAITEHGVFNSSGGSGVLMDRSVFSAINVVNGDSIEFTYVLTINAEA